MQYTDVQKQRPTQTGSSVFNITSINTYDTRTDMGKQRRDPISPLWLNRISNAHTPSVSWSTATCTSTCHL